MSSKNVSLREDVYRELRAVKGDDESFSDVIDRLLAADHDGHPLLKLEELLDHESADDVRERMEAFRERLDDDVERYA